MLRSTELSSRTQGLNIYPSSPGSSLSNNSTINMAISFFFFPVKTLIIFDQIMRGFIHLHWRGKTVHWCFSRFLLQFTQITESDSSHIWPPTEGSYENIPFNLRTHGGCVSWSLLPACSSHRRKVTKEGKFVQIWEQPAQKWKGHVQMEWQGLPSGGTTLDGQSTAKNIQVMLRDTVTWQETWNPAAVCHSKSDLGT